MSHFSAVLVKTETGWVGIEADLTDIVSLDDIVDLMREAAVEAVGTTVVLLIEQDDDWFGVARVDDESDAKIFLSDPRSVRTSELAALLYETVGRGEDPTADPVGDADLLEDLGTDPEALSGLSESAPAGGALLAIAEHAGFAEEYERLR